MNIVPSEFVRVSPDVLRSFAVEILVRVGMKELRASTLADMMVLTDLRGVFSHGTAFLPEYSSMMREGKVNPDPNVSVTKDQGAIAVVDGDGGMGHFAARMAAETAVKKAGEHGVGAATSGNHFHIGAAGLYSRMALAGQCIGFCVSAHRFYPPADRSVLTASGASPMSFAVPTGDGPPMVIDMGCYVDHPDGMERGFEQIPDAFFKMLGLGAACHALGGFMAGIWTDNTGRAGQSWEGATQGAFVMAINVSQFITPADFKREIERHVEEVRRMVPAPGCDEASLPGFLEWEREREWKNAGIPIDPEHGEKLRKLSAEYGVQCPV